MCRCPPMCYFFAVGTGISTAVTESEGRELVSELATWAPACCTSGVTAVAASLLVDLMEVSHTACMRLVVFG
jgi:hypothetical protein